MPTDMMPSNEIWRPTLNRLTDDRNPSVANDKKMHSTKSAMKTPDSRARSSLNGASLREAAAPSTVTAISPSWRGAPRLRQIFIMRLAILLRTPSRLS